MSKGNTSIKHQPLFKSTQLMKLIKIEWNWSWLLITFSFSFSIVLSRTIGLKDLEESCDFLLGLEIIIDIEVLKWEGQWPNSKHTSAMLIILFRYNLSLIILLRCLYDNLSEPKVDKLLHLAMKLINSSSEKETHFVKHLFEISSNMQILIC